MGNDVRAHAFLGVRLYPSKLFGVEKIPVCDHHNDVPTGKTHKFCSMCGKPLWHCRYNPIEAMPGTDLDRLVGPDELKQTIVKSGPYCRFDATRGKDPDTVQWFAVTAQAHSFTNLDYRSNTSYNAESRKISTGISVKDLMEIQKNQLEPLGLWDDWAFGLWAVLEQGLDFDERD